MISLLLISLAAAFNAICDTLKDHFHISVFADKNPAFWNPEISYLNKVFGYVSIDAWHITKALWIACFLLYGYYFEGGFHELIISWILWAIFFELFYSNLLKKTKQ